MDVALKAKKALLGFIDKNNIKKGDFILVGFSGGQDSLALMLIANEIFSNIGVVIINHNILKNSKKVAEGSYKIAEKIGVKKIFLEEVNIKNKANVESEARKERYKVFEKILKKSKAKYLLLAHTKDDQAETVFLNLIRGSGINALKGMPEKRGKFIRPFLSLSRDDTLEICKKYNYKPWFDPSNKLSKDAPLRVQIRENIIPEIEKAAGRSIKNNLYKTANDCQEINEFLQKLAEKNKTLSVSKLKNLDNVLRKIIIRNALIEKGANPSKTLKQHIDKVIELVTNYHGQKKIEIPGNISVIRTSAGKIVIEHGKK